MASNEEIRAWLNQNPNASDDQIFQAMLKNSVSPAQLAQVTGGDPASIQARYNAAGQTFVHGTGVSDYQIRQWLNNNPNATDDQIFAAMQKNNVSPQQLAGVTGGDIAKIQGRYNAAGQRSVQGQNDPLYNKNLGAQPMQTPTGLAGSEQALGAGYESALNSLLAGMGQARSDITGSSQNAQGTIRDALAQAMSGIQSSGQQARQDAQGGYGRAEGYMSPYAAQGQQINPLLMALSGASGQQAFDNAFVESPVQKFLLDRGNRNVLANSAATGGLGGGNVQKELTKFGQGMAGQALQDQINNLMGLSNQGFSGASNAANFAANSGNLLSGIAQNTGQNISNIGLNGANALAGIQTNAGNSLASMSMNGGQTAGQYAMNTGQNLAAGRSQAGRDLASYIGNASGNLANQAQNQAGQYSDIYNTTSGNLANILAASGGANADLLRWLAGSQAQTAQNASGQLSGVPNTALMPANNLQTTAQLLGGFGTMLGAF